MIFMELLSKMYSKEEWCKVTHFMTQFSFPFLEFRNFTGFDLATCDSYFTILVEVFTNHFLAAENTYFTNYIAWTEQKIMILILTKKYQIIQ